ncbi:hypothetical protein MPSEU_000364300 [Mayamaea pseudoterrestris]|nr:hypothetical protein MPSEU_000364300 [Mayamaea pseudoterrestris]
MVISIRGIIKSPLTQLRNYESQAEKSSIIMVAGLKFLSKKGFNPQNLANQEKVWIAEQRKVEEDRRTHELAKQIQQEREQEELAKIAGKSASQYDRGIDWMYNHGQECAKEDIVKEQEEYLLGKAIGSDARLTKGDLAAVAGEQGGFNKVLLEQKKHYEEKTSDSNPATTAAAAWSEPSVAEKNEAFRLRMEDPMYAVMLKSREMDRAVEQKAKLYAKVTRKTAVMVSGNDIHKDNDWRERERKADKREKKRKSKHKKHSRRHRHDASSSESSFDEIRKRSSRHKGRRSRSRSLRRHESDSRRRRRRNSDSDSSMDHDNQNSRSPTPAHGREHGGYDVSRCNSVGKHEESHNGGREAEHDHRRLHAHHHDHTSSPDPKKTFLQRFDQDDDFKVTARGDKYGLQGDAVRINSDFGPDKNLLKRRRDEKDAVTISRRKASQRRGMSSEERSIALRNMQQDALMRREHVKVLLSQGVQASGSTHDDEGRGATPGRASFLSDLISQNHGVGDGSAETPLDERLRKSRGNNRQRSHESFI